MATTVKKTKDSEISTDEGMICAPDRDAGLAYCKAEKGGFEPGHELDDWLEWLEAEQERLLAEVKAYCKKAAIDASRVP